jgi:peptide/nickel transport system permease protein
MLKYISKRLIMAFFTIWLITFVVFFVIQLPPGDFVDTMITSMIAEGETVTQADIAFLKAEYGMDKPMISQYFDWITGILVGDWGTSLYYNQDVLKLIQETLTNTLILSFTTLIFTYVVSIPIAIYSARHQYSIFDYIFSFIGFLGMAIPNFLLAILLMFVSYKWLGKPIMGMFPDGGITDWASFLDFLSRLVIPVIVIGTGGTCALIRTIRAQILDELEKPYVLSTRAKGVSELMITYKYSMKSVLNPIVSGLGPMIKGIFTGSTITAIVLMLPTNGPVLLKALQTQDFYVSGGILLISAILVVIGTVISDILLAVLDPRIKTVEGNR